MKRTEAKIAIDKLFAKAPNYAISDAFAHINNLFSVITVNCDRGEEIINKNHSWEPDEDEVDISKFT